MHKISKQIIKTIEKGNKVFVCGNGGSAMQANHFAAELLGRFEKERHALPVISLSNDIATITAIANDYDYSQVFSRQLEGLGRKDDLLITFSTSGTSLNILTVQGMSSIMGMNRLEFPTKRTGESTAECQERHLKLLHKIAREVENHFA